MLARLEGGRGDWDLLLLDARGNRQVDASHEGHVCLTPQRIAVSGTGDLSS
jgi:hypothetical protein